MNASNITNCLLPPISRNSKRYRFRYAKFRSWNLTLLDPNLNNLNPKVGFIYVMQIQLCWIVSVDVTSAALDCNSCSPSGWWSSRNKQRLAHVLSNSLKPKKEASASNKDTQLLDMHSQPPKPCCQFPSVSAVIHRAVQVQWLVSPQRS